MLVVTKGAAEVVLAMSTLDDAERAAWLDKIAGLAEGAHKVITVASRAVDVSPGPDREPDAGFEFAGCWRSRTRSAKESGRRSGTAMTAGIHPIMVTGDHPLTALAVAKSVGIGGEAPRLVTGEELEGFVTRRKGDELLGVDVIARANRPRSSCW